MVGMTIAALLIIRDDNIRAMLAHDRHELTCHLLYSGLGEGVGLCVGLPAMHARVMVTKRVEMRYTDAAACRSSA